MTVARVVRSPVAELPVVGGSERFWFRIVQLCSERVRAESPAPHRTWETRRNVRDSLPGEVGSE